MYNDVQKNWFDIFEYSDWNVYDTQHHKKEREKKEKVKKEASASAGGDRS